MDSIKHSIGNKANVSPSLLNLLDLIFKSCPDGIVYKDNKLRYKAMNNAFCDFFKINNSKNYIGSDCLDFLSAKNKTKISDVNKRILEELKPINYIMDYKNKILNITTAPIIENNEFYGTMSIVKDITYEENVKEKFVLKYSQLKSLIDNIPMLVYMQDKYFNYIVLTEQSKNFLSTGIDNFSKIQIDSKLFKENDIEDNTKIIKTNKIIEKELKLKDNFDIYHWYKVCKVPINNFQNEIIGIITLINNIDAEKQLQSQRETFVASVGHDLKNPTIAQIRSLELLLKGNFGEISNTQKEILEMVLDSCRYMNGMLSSLLATYRNYGGICKLHFEEFTFSDLINECVSEMLYVAKDKEVNICTTETVDIKIIADRIQIKRVIMNLLSNGIKYAYKNTNLILNQYLEGSDLCFNFENNSPYIPKDKQKSIFAKYISYASVHKELGCGLGLYASKKIIEAHNGTLFVESFENNHNIFGFKIPLTQDYENNVEVYL